MPYILTARLQNTCAVDLTCMAPWRDGQGTGSWAPPLHRWPVTAITPRHIVCGHVPTWVGESYHWFTADNTVVSRTVTARRIFRESYWVAILDSPLPCPDPELSCYEPDPNKRITPAKIMPKDFILDYLPSLKTLPVPIIGTDQEKHAITSFMMKSIKSNGSQ